MEDETWSMKNLVKEVEVFSNGRFMIYITEWKGSLKVNF